MNYPFKKVRATMRQNMTHKVIVDATFNGQKKCPLSTRKDGHKKAPYFGTSLRQPGYPLGTRSFASPGRPGFALIGELLIFLRFSI